MRTLKLLQRNLLYMLLVLVFAVGCDRNVDLSEFDSIVTIGDTTYFTINGQSNSDGRYEGDRGRINTIMHGAELMLSRYCNDSLLDIYIIKYPDVQPPILLPAEIGSKSDSVNCVMAN